MRCATHVVWTGLWCLAVFIAPSAPRRISTTYFLKKDRRSCLHGALIDAGKVGVFVRGLPPEIGVELVVRAYASDDEGDAAQALMLSKRRADAVAALLARNGVPESGIRREYKGNEESLVTNIDESNRRLNRCVVIAASAVERGTTNGLGWSDSSIPTPKES